MKKNCLNNGGSDLCLFMRRVVKQIIRIIESWSYHCEIDNLQSFIQPSSVKVNFLCIWNDRDHQHVTDITEHLTIGCSEWSETASFLITMTFTFAMEYVRNVLAEQEVWNWMGRSSVCQCWLSYCKGKGKGKVGSITGHEGPNGIRGIAWLFL